MRFYRMMRKQAGAVAALFLALAGCQRDPDDPVREEEIVTPTNGASSADLLPDADIEQSLGPLGADPRRPSEERRYVGRWATDPADCADRAWRFTEEELHTPAGSVCRFTQVRPVADGYDIDARCTAEGPEQADRIRIRFAESAGAMLFESDAIADAGLEQCEM